MLLIFTKKICVHYFTKKNVSIFLLEHFNVLLINKGMAIATGLEYQNINRRFIYIKKHAKEVVLFGPKISNVVARKNVKM